MKVAVTATEPSLDARVDPRFGRCPFFLIVETDDGSVEAIENGNVSLGGGAGIQSAQLMAETGVQTVLTGNCGPNAYQTLSAASIGVIVGCSGTVAEVVEQFKAGQLNAAGQPNVAGKFGLGGGPSAPGNLSMPPQQPPAAGAGMGMGGGGGRGMGGGMGRGMGRGRGGGRGMGGGMGRGRGMAMGPGFGPGPVAAPQPPAESPTPGDELTMLKQQAEAMSRQMQQIQERIKQLEQGS
jgi:predicted Fe-Mo cluster-binding NifX family protein